MRHVTHRMQAFLDGELTPAAVEAVREHLASCGPCRQELAARQQLWRQVDTLAAVPNQVAIWPRLAALLQERGRRRWSWPYRGLALAAALGGVLLGWRVGQPAGSNAASHDLAAEAGYLADSVPSLDQLWLQAAINGESES